MFDEKERWKERERDYPTVYYKGILYIGTYNSNHVSVLNKYNLFEGTAEEEIYFGYARRGVIIGKFLKIN